MRGQVDEPDQVVTAFGLGEPASRSEQPGLQHMDEAVASQPLTVLSVLLKVVGAIALLASCVIFPIFIVFGLHDVFGCNLESEPFVLDPRDLPPPMERPLCETGHEWFSVLVPAVSLVLGSAGALVLLGTSRSRASVVTAIVTSVVLGALLTVWLAWALPPLGDLQRWVRVW